ncbi:MAG: DUF6465 family protein [Ruminococcus flavefaciens]|nr:DUF6465 family protein [Ruminococcus flavefaciens]MCM1229166.1 DUF6465 family protein [Ruminococcus flavefaciens]
MPRKKSTTAKTAEVKEEIKTAEVVTAEEAPAAVEEKPKSKRGRKPAAKKAVPVAEEKAVAEEIVEVEVEVAPVAEEAPVEAPAPVEEKAPAEEKKPASKKSTAKKTTAKKTATKKTTAKKTTKKEAPVEVAPVAEEKPAKKTASRKASVNVFFQYQGMESAELVNKAKEISGVKSPKSVNIYIKPEDNKVYFTVDDTAGSFDL